MAQLLVSDRQVTIAEDGFEVFQRQTEIVIDD